MEAGASSLAMDATGFDLAKVRQERCQDLVRAAHQAARTQVEVAVGDVVEAVDRRRSRARRFGQGLSLDLSIQGALYTTKFQASDWHSRMLLRAKKACGRVESKKKLLLHR